MGHDHTISLEKISIPSTLRVGPSISFFSVIPVCLPPYVKQFPCVLQSPYVYNSRMPTILVCHTYFVIPRMPVGGDPLSHITSRNQ